jgi:hypothetical protein
MMTASTILASLLCLFFSLVVLYATHRVFTPFGNKNSPSLIIKYLIYYKTFFYFLLPAILRCLSNWQFEYSLQISAYEVVTIYALELVSTMVFLLVINSLRSSWKVDKVKRVEIGAQNFFIWISMALYLSYQFTQIYSLFFGELTWLWGYAWPFESYAKNIGATLSFYLLCARKVHGNKIFLLGLLGCVTYLNFAFITGVRGQIIHPIFFILFMLGVVFKNKQSVFFIILFLPVLLTFSNQFKQIRNLELSSSFDVSSVMSESKADDSLSTLLSDIEFRYGETTRACVVLLRDGVDGKGVGFKPFFNALYAPLPRSFFEDKPVPGSVDGNKYSMAMYYVQWKLYGTWNMVEIISSMHAFWEFGFLGLFFAAIIAALYMSIVVRYLGRLGILSIPFILMFCKSWGYNEPKVILYEIPLQIFQFIIPIICLFSIYKAFILFRAWFVMRFCTRDSL